MVTIYLLKLISINKTESAQKVAKILFDDYESPYRTLLLKGNTMTVHSLRYLCGGIYTTLNGLNPSYMKNMFKKIRHFKVEKNAK